MKGISLDRFCREENINVTKGVVTGMIRPAGRKDVTITFSGLDFNTPDNLVCDYIRKFGGTVKNINVIYCKFTEGPFRGKFNGERKYQVDFTNSTTTMGTYHFLDGAKVRVFYKGNEKTCGRCHKPARSCIGAGIARDCEGQGGVRVHLSDHMRELWSKIGFNPTSFELPDIVEGEGDKPIVDMKNFQRPAPENVKTQADIDRYCGLRINNLPLSLSDEDIIKFLVEQVDTSINKEVVNIMNYKKTKSAIISAGLSSETVTKVLEKIDFTTSRNMFMEVPLYCRPLRDITPEKQQTPPSKSSTESGARPRIPLPRIPGLPPQAQAKAIDRKNKKIVRRKCLLKKKGRQKKKKIKRKLLLMLLKL